MRPQNKNLKRTAGPGRPKGSRDKIPRSFRASVAQLYRDLADEQPELYRDAIERGLRSEPPKSFPYLQLAASYIDGKPRDHIDVDLTDARIPLEVFREIAQAGRRYKKEAASQNSQNKSADEK